MTKFLRGVAGIPFKRRDVKRIAKAFCEDRPKALAGLRGACEDVVTLRFEDILADPLAAAVELEAVVDQALDVSAMARAVLPRDGACRPDLGIEVMLAGLGKPQGFWGPSLPSLENRLGQEEGGEAGHAS